MPFRVDLHVYHHPDMVTAERLVRIETLLGEVFRNSERTMTTYDDIKAKMDTALESIQKNTDLDSAILQAMNAETETIKQLKQQLDNAGTDQDKLVALSATMDQIIQKSQNEAQVKADAIKANTDQPAEQPTDDAPPIAPTGDPGAGQGTENQQHGNTNEPTSDEPPTAA